MDYNLLNTLLVTDPDGVGFAPYLDISDVECAALFNDLSGRGAASITLTQISKGQFLRGIIPATDQLASGVDLNNTAIPATTTAKWKNRFDALRSGNDIITVDATLVGLVTQLISDGLCTQVQIAAFTTRTGSYAEVKFGQETIISWQDIARARGRMQ